MNRLRTLLLAALAVISVAGCKNGGENYLNDKLYETPGMGQALPIRATFLDEISWDIPHQNWGVKEWDRDFRAMKDMGINTVVMIRCGLGRWIAAPFESVLNANPAAIYPPVDLVEMFLTLADKYGMAFYFGTYDSGQWWHEGEYQKEIDVNNALNGDGPFAPERSGTLPADQLVRLCFSGKYSQTEIMKFLAGNGGCQALLGIKDMKEISRRAELGEEPYHEVLEAMLYTVSKQIGAMAVALWGKVDAIILTGGIAFSNYCVEEIKKQVAFLAPVIVMPGEGEMRSLAFNALGALNGELPIQEYT